PHRAIGRRWTLRLTDLLSPGDHRQAGEDREECRHLPPLDHLGRSPHGRYSSSGASGCVSRRIAAIVQGLPEIRTGPSDLDNTMDEPKRVRSTEIEHIVPARWAAGQCPAPSKTWPGRAISPSRRRRALVLPRSSLGTGSDARRQNRRKLTHAARPDFSSS